MQELNLNPNQRSPPKKKKAATTTTKRARLENKATKISIGNHALASTIRD